MKSYTEITLDEFKQLIRPTQREKNWQEDKGETPYGRLFFSGEPPSPWDTNVIFLDAGKSLPKEVSDSMIKDNLFQTFPIRNCQSIARLNNLNEFVKKSIELGFDPEEYLSFSNE